MVCLPYIYRYVWLYVCMYGNGLGYQTQKLKKVIFYFKLVFLLFQTDSIITQSDTETQITKKLKPKPKPNTQLIPNSYVW
jgi:hypothetical protein